VIFRWLGTGRDVVLCCDVRWLIASRDVVLLCDIQVARYRP